MTHYILIFSLYPNECLKRNSKSFPTHTFKNLSYLTYYIYLIITLNNIITELLVNLTIKNKRLLLSLLKICWSRLKLINI